MIARNRTQSKAQIAPEASVLVPVADRDGNIVCYYLRCPDCGHWSGIRVHTPAMPPFHTQASTALDQITIAQDALAHLKAVIEEGVL